MQDVWCRSPGIPHIAGSSDHLLLFFLIGYVLVKIIPYLNASLFNSRECFPSPSRQCLIMTLVSLAIAAPVGIFAAIFLVEYAKKGSRFVSDPYYRRNFPAFHPSYGLFGMLFFVTALHWGMYFFPVP